jgi:GH24 family phage-related lysozyme (muramidase)
MAAGSQIDWDFIHEQEGNSKTEAYVPVCTPKSVVNKLNKLCFGKEEGSVIGKSGVTIGAGFDLGQRNAYDLKQLNLPSHLNDVVKPFLELKKDDAVKALEEYEKKNGNKLMITTKDANTINQAVKGKTLNVLAKNFNNESNVKFENLPANAQTALASFAFQYGENMNKHGSDFVKKVWSGYIKQDYKGLILLLDSAKDYKQRRKNESELLKSIK